MRETDIGGCVEFWTREFGEGVEVDVVDDLADAVYDDLYQCKLESKSIISSIRWLYKSPRDIHDIQHSQALRKIRNMQFRRHLVS